MNRVLNAARTFLKEADLLLLALCLIACHLWRHCHLQRHRLSRLCPLCVVQCLGHRHRRGFYILLSLIDIDIIAERRELLMIFNVLFISTLISPLASRATPATEAGSPSPFCPSTSSPPRSAN